LIEKRLDHPERSAELLSKVVELEPGNSDAQYLLGQSLLRLGKNAEAVSHWKKAVANNPSHGEALYNLSRTLTKIDPTEARQYQERFVELQKKRQITDRADTLGNFALASVKAHDLDQALAQFTEAIRVCDDCRSLGDLHKNLGLVYCRSGDLVNGERELRAALKLKPNDPDILKSLRIIEGLGGGK